VNKINIKVYFSLSIVLKRWVPKTKKMFGKEGNCTRTAEEADTKTEHNHISGS
jgi:hypothetical protein